MAERVTRVARDAVATAIVLRREVDYAQHGVWGKRVGTLFPGYVIVPARDVDGLEQALSLITEYHHLVRVGGAPAELSAEDVATFAGLADADWVIRASVGDIVDGVLKVKQGPLMGREDLVGRIDRHRRLAYFKPGAFPLFTGEQARRRADRVSGAGRRMGQRPPCVGLQVVSKT